jgi:hypothetical protein
MRNPANNLWRPEMEGDCEYIPPLHVLDRLHRKGLVRLVTRVPISRYARSRELARYEETPEPPIRYCLTEAGYHKIRGGR